MELEEEKFKSAIEQINYYINIPRNIKGTHGNEKQENQPQSQRTDFEPAHVVDGAITVINGRLNIPHVAFFGL